MPLKTNSGGTHPQSGLKNAPARNKARSAAAHRWAAPRHSDLVGLGVAFERGDVFGCHKALTFMRWIAVPRPSDALGGLGLGPCLAVE